MKSTNTFKETIKNYLDKRAESDSLFAAAYAKEGKNLDDCINYILGAVHKSGCNGFTDDEVYNMAVHYYDEDNIEIGKPVNCKVVVNHSVDISEEEKEEARQKALQEIVDQEKKRLLNKPQKAAPKPKETEVQQASLF